MAQKKRKKRRWLRTILFYLLFPFVVWLGALLVWFFWSDLTRSFSKPAAKTPASAKSETKVERLEKSAAQKPEEPVTDRSQEKLADEERQKLDAILKRLQERKASNE